MPPQSPALVQGPHHGQVKRQAKKALIPGYGKKGMGWVRNPRKAAYNNRQRRMAWLENVDKSAYIASEAIEGIGGNFVVR